MPGHPHQRDKDRCMYIYKNIHIKTGALPSAGYILDILHEPKSSTKGHRCRGYSFVTVGCEHHLTTLTYCTHDHMKDFSVASGFRLHVGCHDVGKIAKGSFGSQVIRTTHINPDGQFYFIGRKQQVFADSFTPTTTV